MTTSKQQPQDDAIVRIAVETLEYISTSLDEHNSWMARQALARIQAAREAQGGEGELAAANARGDAWRDKFNADTDELAKRAKEIDRLKTKLDKVSMLETVNRAECHRQQNLLIQTRAAMRHALVRESEMPLEVASGLWKAVEAIYELYDSSVKEVPVDMSAAAKLKRVVDEAFREDEETDAMSIAELAEKVRKAGWVQAAEIIEAEALREGEAVHQWRYADSSIWHDGILGPPINDSAQRKIEIRVISVKPAPRAEIVRD